MRTFLNLKKAFTLIELLIVVAIIAILAAIAVPNFLEAQTRSKVSRAKADMRSLAVAIESYAVDANKYPVPDDEDGHSIVLRTAAARAAAQEAGAPHFVETRIPTRLTTPVAYITALPAEPFPARTASEPNPLFHFGTLEYARLTEGEEGMEEFFEYIEILTGSPNASVKYFILSHGPDLDHDAPGEHHHHERATTQEEEHGAAALYDPSNGTVSNGDIVYFGPGYGFGK